MKYNSTILSSKKFLSEEEVTYLQSLLTRWETKEPRNVLMIRLLLTYGMRISELLDMRMGDVDITEFRVKGSKSSNPREFPMSEETARALYNQIALVCKSPDDRIFPLHYNRVRQIWFDYRPVKKKVHSLRHTFAVRLYLSTKDIRLVQKALGHKHIATTMIYQEFFYTKEEFKRLLAV